MHFNWKGSSYRGYVPAAITFVRALLMLPFAVLLLNQRPPLYDWAMILWGVAALLDVADGYLARKWNAVTELGAIMDLVADRIMIVVALVLLAILHIANAYLVLLIISRELLVDSIRARQIAKGFVAPHNVFGQLKMLAIVIAILCALSGLADLLPRRSAGVLTDSLLLLALTMGLASVVRVCFAKRSSA